MTWAETVGFATFSQKGITQKISIFLLVLNRKIEEEIV
jgi:hypothetical protein